MTQQRALDAPLVPPASDPAARIPGAPYDPARVMADPLVARLVLPGTGTPNSHAIAAHATQPLKGINLTGAAAEGITTPDHPSLDLAGNVEFVTLMRMADWTPGAGRIIAAKNSNLSPQTGGFTFTVTSGNNFAFQAGDGTTGYSTPFIAVPAAWADNSWHLLRFRLRLNDGSGNRVFSVEESLDGGTNWAHIAGSPASTAGTIASIANVTQGFRLGSDVFGNNRVVGDYAYAILRNGFDGPTAVSIDFRDRSQGWEIADTAGATGIDATGKIVTLSGTVMVLGLHDVLGDLDLRAIDAIAADWTAASSQTFVAKWIDLGFNERAYLFRVNTTGNLTLNWSNDGTANLSATSTATLGSVGAVDGQPISVRVTLDVVDGANRTVTFYYSFNSGETWTVLGAPVTTAGNTSIDRGVAGLSVGAYNNGSVGSASPFVGSIRRIEVRDGLNGQVVASPDFSDWSKVGDGFVVSPEGSVFTLVSPASLGPITKAGPTPFRPGKVA